VKRVHDISAAFLVLSVAVWLFAIALGSNAGAR